MAMDVLQILLVQRRTGKRFKKGDVATRYHVDNPAYGTKLKCVANGHTKTMIKRDVGCLPNAVLDIWKYGVEYFGKIGA